LPELTFRRLLDEDAHLYQALRLEALKESPESFGATFEEDAERTEADFVLRLNNDFAVGCFQGDSLIGSADFFVAEPNRSKLSHKGSIAGYYVRPRHRGTGVAAGLMEEIIANLPDGITQLNLSAVANNPQTIGFYEKAGFTIWGTEPRGSRSDGSFIDEVHMVRMLDAD
jgi:RimJ/RimL family protein N-acetyltransferase